MKSNLSEFVVSNFGKQVNMTEYDENNLPSRHLPAQSSQ